MSQSPELAGWSLRSGAERLGEEAVCVAGLFAVDPVGLGGVLLRARAGSMRDDWLALLSRLLPAGTPCRRVPLHTGDDRLLGGLDLSATLHAGRPVAQTGLLAQADGGIVQLLMAERLGTDTAARIAAVLDTAEVVTQRDGIARRRSSHIGVVALDEGIADDERPPSNLAERLAFHLSLVPGASSESATATATATATAPEWSAQDVLEARERLASVTADDSVIDVLCSAAWALGISSARATLLALNAARASASLAGRLAVEDSDVVLAARLVLGPRATVMPAASGDAEAPPSPAPADREASPDDADGQDGERNGASDDDGDPPQAEGGQALEEVVLAAAAAAVPERLLSGLPSTPVGRSTSAASSGRSGAVRSGQRRGRPNGVRQGVPGAGGRLSLIETLRAAAPWQALRRREAATSASSAGVIVEPARICIRREDFRVVRFEQRSETTTMFVVDASGSAALHRLAETKGAIELLLADCYVRRDSVAVIAFRGRGAELLLPPTRSLVRARRSLAGLPGGGGTPLAAGLDAASALVDTLRGRGNTPLVVLLTDGRANVARDGGSGRTRAGADAIVSATRMRATGAATLLMDTSPQPQQTARDLARAMGAMYLPLPHAGAQSMSAAVRTAGLAGRRAA